MNEYVADNHALYWYLLNSPHLGKKASDAFDEADAGSALIYIPSIVLAELYFLNIKHGRPIDFADEYKKLDAGGQFILTVLNRVMFWISTLIPPSKKFTTE